MSLGVEDDEAAMGRNGHLRAAAAFCVLYLAATALVALLVPERGMPPLEAVILAAALIALSVIDAATFTLPDAITLPLIAAGLLLGSLQGADSLALAMLSAGTGYLLVRVIDAAYLRLRGRHGIGGGDAKLLAAGGAWVGILGLPAVLLMACLSALVELCTARIRSGEMSADDRIAFGPHLALGIWLTWLIG